MQPVQLTESFFDLQLSMPAPDQKQVSQESFMYNYINHLYACVNWHLGETDSITFHQKAKSATGHSCIG